jgi:prepilin-type N-terminal cleavage/methylation domain-containing protein
MTASRARQPRRRRFRFGAFTLVEVLVTLALVGITFPVVMTGVTLSLQAADDARKKEEASGLAQQKLSELVESAGNGESAQTSGDFGADHPGFTWQAQVSNVDTDLDQVSVRVSWTSRGRERGLELAGYAYTGTGPSTSGSLGTSATSGGRQ